MCCGCFWLEGIGVVALSLKRSLRPSIYLGSELLCTYRFSLRYKILLVPADRKKRADASIPFLAKLVYPITIWRHIVCPSRCTQEEFRSYRDSFKRRNRQKLKTLLVRSIASLAWLPHRTESGDEGMKILKIFDLSTRIRPPMDSQQVDNGKFSLGERPIPHVFTCPLLPCKLFSPSWVVVLLGKD